jgi:hypothetical protein
MIAVAQRLFVIRMNGKAAEGEDLFSEKQTPIKKFFRSQIHAA